MTVLNNYWYMKWKAFFVCRKQMICIKDNTYIFILKRYREHVLVQWSFAIIEKLNINECIYMSYKWTAVLVKNWKIVNWLNNVNTIKIHINQYTHIYTNARCPQWRLCLTLADIKAEMLNMPEGVGEVWPKTAMLWFWRTYINWWLALEKHGR